MLGINSMSKGDKVAFYVKRAGLPAKKVIRTIRTLSPEFAVVRFNKSDIKLRTQQIAEWHHRLN